MSKNKIILGLIGLFLVLSVVGGTAQAARVDHTGDGTPTLAQAFLSAQQSSQEIEKGVRPLRSDPHEVRALVWIPWPIAWLASIIGWGAIWYWIGLLGMFVLLAGILVYFQTGYWPWWCPLNLILHL